MYSNYVKKKKERNTWSVIITFIHRARAILLSLEDALEIFKIDFALTFSFLYSNNNSHPFASPVFFIITIAAESVREINSSVFSCV